MTKSSAYKALLFFTRIQKTLPVSPISELFLNFFAVLQKIPAIRALKICHFFKFDDTYEVHLKLSRVPAIRFLQMPAGPENFRHCCLQNQRLDKFQQLI